MSPQASQQQLLSHYMRLPYTSMLYPPPAPHPLAPLELSPRHSPYSDHRTYMSNHLGVESALQAMHRKALSEGDFEGQPETRLPQQNSLPLPSRGEEAEGSSRELSPFRSYWRRNKTESSCGGSSGSRSRSISPRPPLDQGGSQGASPHRTDSKGSSGSSAGSKVGMELEKCTVWFGNVKTKCHKPVVIHENGIKMVCTYEGQGERVIIISNSAVGILIQNILVSKNSWY